MEKLLYKSLTDQEKAEIDQAEQAIEEWAERAPSENAKKFIEVARTGRRTSSFEMDWNDSEKAWFSEFPDLFFRRKQLYSAAYADYLKQISQLTEYGAINRLKTDIHTTAEKISFNDYAAYRHKIKLIIAQGMCVPPKFIPKDDRAVHIECGNLIFEDEGTDKAQFLYYETAAAFQILNLYYDYKPTELDELLAEITKKSGLSVTEKPESNNLETNKIPVPILVVSKFNPEFNIMLNSVNVDFLTIVQEPEYFNSKINFSVYDITPGGIITLTEYDKQVYNCLNNMYFQKVGFGQTKLNPEVTAGLTVKIKLSDVQRHMGGGEHLDTLIASIRNLTAVKKRFVYKKIATEEYLLTGVLQKEHNVYYFYMEKLSYSHRGALSKHFAKWNYSPYAIPIRTSPISERVKIKLTDSISLIKGKKICREISLDNLYHEIGITERYEKSRAKKAVEKCLNTYIENGDIKGYKIQNNTLILTL